MIEFGMFTDEGNKRVRNIVANGIAFGSSWLQVYQQLVNLSEVKGFEEATDTVVREAAWMVFMGENA